MILPKKVVPAALAAAASVLLASGSPACDCMGGQEHGHGEVHVRQGVADGHAVDHVPRHRPAVLAGPVVEDREAVRAGPEVDVVALERAARSTRPVVQRDRPRCGTERLADQRLGDPGPGAIDASIRVGGYSGPTFVP